MTRDQAEALAAKAGHGDGHRIVFGAYQSGWTGWRIPWVRCHTCGVRLA